MDPPGQELHHLQHHHQLQAARTARLRDRVAATGAPSKAGIASSVAIAASNAATTSACVIIRPSVVFTRSLTISRRRSPIFTLVARRRKTATVAARAQAAKEQARRSSQEAGVIDDEVMAEFGSDPEAVMGEDIASRIIKAIRRIVQLRRRLSELNAEIDVFNRTMHTNSNRPSKLPKPMVKIHLASWRLN